MKIFNIRLGLATNSSSSHSLIFIKDKKPSDFEVGDYGWNCFIAASKTAKIHYFASTIRCSIDCLIRDFMSERKKLPNREHHELLKTYAEDKYSADEEYIAYCTDNIVEEIFKDETPKDFGDIDHQSIYSVPRSFDGKGLDMEFLKDFQRFILQDDLVVLGGNDNDGEHPLSTGKEFILPFQECGYDWVCRKDHINNYWVMFNKDSGSKIRFSFDENFTSRTSYWDKEDYLQPQKAFAPELVDIKITDFCDIGCKFCYQDSTNDGIHAKTKDIYNMIDVLAKLKVFEIAIGGGEPTKHPDFIKILKYARRKGIVPNFTTKSFDWLWDKRINKKILKYCGAFAYSIGSVKEFEDLLRGIENYKISSDKVAIHIVMGTMNRANFMQVLTLAAHYSIRVTLLGYKNIGRGPQFKPLKYGWWLNTISSIYRTPSISVDTALAAEAEKDIAKAGVIKEMFHTEEGKFSAYFDAVTKQLAPSSYCDKALYVKIDDINEKNFLDIFKDF